MDSARSHDPSRAGRDRRIDGRRRLGLIAAATLLLVAACSGITENDDGIASLDLQSPASTYLELGSSIRLSAVARNAAGDSIEAPIRWRTPDTTVTLDSLTGVVTPLYGSGSARIQVGVFGQDTIVTTLGALTLTLTAKADSIVLRPGDDSLTITTDAGTAQFRVTVLGGTPAAGVLSRPVAFRIIDPVATDSPTVVFQASGRASDSLITDAAGNATATVRAGTGRVPPDRAVAEFVAHRANGERILGSGRQVVIRFLHR